MVRNNECNDEASCRTFHKYSSLWKKCVSADTEAETQTRKKLQIRVKFAFRPSETKPKRIFSRNTFFPKTGIMV
jgi:hypothetical protein